MTTFVNNKRLIVICLRFKQQRNIFFKSQSKKFIKMFDRIMAKIIMNRSVTNTLTKFRLQPSEFNFIRSISLEVLEISLYSDIDHILMQNLGLVLHML